MTLDRAVGHLSAETICSYPPGIPLLVRGEVVTLSHVAALQALSQVLSQAVSGGSSDSGGDSSSDGDSGRDAGAGAPAARLGSGCTVTGCTDSSLRTIKVITLP